MRKDMKNNFRLNKILKKALQFVQWKFLQGKDFNSVICSSDLVSLCTTFKSVYTIPMNATGKKANLLCKQ